MLKKIQGEDSPPFVTAMQNGELRTFNGHKVGILIATRENFRLSYDHALCALADQAVELGRFQTIRDALRDALRFYDKVSNGTLGEGWTTREVQRLEEIRKLVASG